MNLTSIPNHSMHPDAGKYLTVSLAGESYGIADGNVREIIRLQKITPVPEQPAHVRGVINLRGRIIPIVDLRLRLDLPASSDDSTCIVVVQVDRGAAAQLQMGMIVDRVEDVTSIGRTEVQATPDFGTTVSSEFLQGLARVKDQVKLILDIDRVVGALTPVAAGTPS